MRSRCLGVPQDTETFLHRGMWQHYMHLLNTSYIYPPFGTSCSVVLMKEAKLMYSAQSFPVITFSMNFPVGQTHHFPIVLHHGSIFHPHNLPQGLLGCFICISRSSKTSLCNFHVKWNEWKTGIYVCVSVCVFLVKVLPNSPPRDILILVAFTKSLSRGWTVWSFLIFAGRPTWSRFTFPPLPVLLWMRRFWCHHGSVPNAVVRFSRSERLARPIAPSLQQMALARSWTTDQQMERLPVSFSQTIKCVSGSVLFGWPGDEVWSYFCFSDSIFVNCC